MREAGKRLPRKWRENEKMESKWRANKKMERKWIENEKNGEIENGEMESGGGKVGAFLPLHVFSFFAIASPFSHSPAFFSLETRTANMFCFSVRKNNK